MRRSAIATGMAWAAVALLGSATAQAQWTQTGGPTGGEIRGLMDDGEKLIVSVGNDVYHYDDERWRKVGAFPAVDFSRQTRWGDLFQKKEGVLMAHYRGHAFRSTDDGATWTAVHTASGGIVRDDEAFYLLEDDPAYQSDSRIFRSIDGATWEETGVLPLTAVPPVIIGGTMYTVVSYGTELLTSNDDGASWDTLRPDFPFNDPSTAGTMISAVVRGQDHLYVKIGVEIFESADGVAWRNITDDLPPGIDGWQITAKGRYLFLHTTGNGLYRYNGSEWIGMPIENVSMLAATEEGIVYTTRNGGIYAVDEDVRRPVSIADGLVRSTIWTLGAVDGAVLTHTGKGLFRSDDAGDTWRWIETFDGWTSLGFYTYGDVIYALGGNVHRSFDRGSTWEIVGPEYPFELEGGSHYSNITAVVATDDALYYGIAEYLPGKGGGGWSDGGVFRSDDDGETWVRAVDGLPYDGFYTPAPVVDMEMIDGALVAATAAGVYRSTNRGERWVPAMTGIDPADREYGGGTLTRAAGALILRMHSNSYVSTDAGVSWTANLPAMPDGEGWTTVAFTLDDELYMQTYTSPSHGVFEYSLFKFDGTEWVDVTSWQPEGVIFTSMVRSGDYYYGGTMHDGVWRLSREQSIANGSGTTGVADEVIADGIRLTGAPNPADGAMSVEATLPEATGLRVTLVSIFGREMIVLHDGHVDAGTRSFTIETDELPSGTYYVRLTTSNGASKVVPVRIMH